MGKHPKCQHVAYINTNISLPFGVTLNQGKIVAGNKLISERKFVLGLCMITSNPKCRRETLPCLKVSIVFFSDKTGADVTPY